jgi:Fe-S-cluster containining protein
MSPTASQELPENIQELSEDAEFCFDCNPEVPCFNHCCAKLTLPLTPYDMLRLCRHLGMGSKEFFASFVTMHFLPDTGFPMPLLRMLHGPEETCPFVTPAGCLVYEDRPSACRLYPLGRNTSISPEDVTEHFFILQEAHCHGFDKGSKRTAHQWLADQGLQPFIEANDKYMRLISLAEASGTVLGEKMASMSVLALFQPDKFREFLTAMPIFKRVEISAERKAAIMEDSLAGDEAALNFGLDWMELAIFGRSPNLEKKD